jgi:hypothetical protein
MHSRYREKENKDLVPSNILEEQPTYDQLFQSYAAEWEHLFQNNVEYGRETNIGTFSEKVHKNT